MEAEVCAFWIWGILLGCSRGREREGGGGREKGGREREGGGREREGGGVRLRKILIMRSENFEIFYDAPAKGLRGANSGTTSLLSI